jgi:ribonuclease HI
LPSDGDGVEWYGAGMSHPIEIWAHALAVPEPGYGGWAYVMRDGKALSGAAGGGRRATAQDMLLTAVLEALGKFAADRPASVRANLLPDEAGADPALWRRLQARPGVGFALAADPFLKAWADEGQKQAKTRGAFSAAIPKPNLKAFRPAF